MLEFLKDRVSIIVALIIGTGSGWTMTDFIDAPEIKKRLIAIAIAVSLLFSLLVSFYLKGKNAAARKKTGLRIIWISVAVFLVFTTLFFYTSDKLTVSWGVENNKMEIVDTVIMVKGLYYAEPAKKYIASETSRNHFAPGDDKILEAFDYKIGNIWNNTSITLSRLLILFLYTTMMAGFTSGITALIEILTPKKAVAKPKE